MRSEPSKVNPGESSRSVAERRRRALRRRKQRNTSLEWLEARQLLAQLPAAVVSTPVRVSISNGNYSNPSIAIDPTNPNNLVMFWVRNDPANIAADQQPVRVEGARSTNGGTTWTSIGTLYTRKIDPSTASGTPAFYAQATDPSVAFDRNGNIHLVIAQHSADNNNGEIQYNKIDFTTLARTEVVLTSWVSSVTPVNRALKPTIAVDSGVTSFTDTDANGTPYTQTTNGAGNVYVAWATNDDAPSGASNWNPNAIRMVASFNNGVAFGPVLTVNNGGNGGSQRNTAPRITVSQGTGTTAGGQVTVVWDDFGSGATASPPVDIIKVQRYRPQAGVLAAVGTNLSPATTLVRGRQDYGGQTSSAAQPLGIGPAPAIASDNTLGAFSPFQGRLYITYVGRFDDSNNPASNTDIYLITSNDGGATWSTPVRVNDDVGVTDGYSGADVPGLLFTGPTSTIAQGGRAQLMPSVAVDQLTGTLVVSYSDTRFDAAEARVAQMIATSIDGGATFGPQTFANASQTATDQATGRTVVLGPIPDNNSSGNNMQDKDGTFGFGDHQALAVAGGRVIPAWSSNANGGNDGRELLRIRVGQVQIAGGPRIVDGTMGPVSNSLATDGGPLANSFTVTFDRRIDPTTFTAADVQMVGRGVDGALLSFQPVVTGVAALDTNALGATQFQVTFQTQATPGPSTPGTYSYSVGPNIADRIRRANAAGVQVSAGNIMDQNGNATTGQGNADRFAVPKPTGTTPFVAPYDRDSLPLVVPGPRVVSSSINGQPVTSDNLVLNGTVSSIDVTFDRDMNASTFEADGRDVLRIQGPAGLITGPFTVTPLSARTFRIGFPTQQLSGTYTIVLGSEIQSTSGLAIDTDQDAGVDVLRGTSTSAPVPLTFNSTAPLAIPAGGTVTSTITVPSVNDFVIQAATLALNITFPRDPDLTVDLIAPDGTTVVNLFSGVGSTGTQANFTNTVFDDAATTSIVNGGPPFFGRFRPLDTQGLNKLNNSSSIGGPLGTGAGVYTLRITNAGSSTGTLSNWSITLSKPVSGTGLGELVADRTSLGFRIFTMDPTNPLASTTWTSVGPAAITVGNSTGAGRIGGLAVDPSDPSGNTVYVAGATGGVWKTNNFLTTDPNGPTYIPLTDFGPTLGINIGGIAVFGRNNDPNQSVVIASTGDGDGGISGVGFLRSLNGGATWTLLDSTNNNLPFASRDHAFVGSTSFKVVADPNPSPSGQVILYAALSGNNGGVWRSTDTGNTWVRSRAGQATDVLLDPGSGPVDAIANPTGNLQVVYAGFRGEGVFLSPNQGQVWSQMVGGVGNPVQKDPDLANQPPIPVQNQGATPNGAKGRIVLAKPALVPASEPNATLRNLLYQGWLFAFVATPNDFQDGFYVTKDQGQNWTKIRIPGLGAINNAKRVVPSNNTSLADYDVLGDPAFQGQGNYDIAITVDPNDPNIIYLGGFSSQPSAFVRVDISRLGDPHAYYLAQDRNDGGTLFVNATDGATMKQNPLYTPSVFDGLASQNRYRDPRFSPTTNLIRNPFNPLGGNSTFNTPGITSMNNTGAGTRWMPIDGLMNGGDIHRLLAIRDPLTGKSRLIIGNDHGVWSTVDNGDGTIDSGIGTAVAPSVSRNGNLQITQFYYGAAQPSSAAAQVAQALFYGQAQDDGFPRSSGDVLTTGNIRWGFSGRGDGTGVATDQTGSGTLYQYNWPCCGGNKTDFFLVNGVGRTFGLIQQSGSGQVPDPQWPNTGGFNFAVNPINGRQIVISSAAGRVFRTQDQGQFWLVIGEPGALDGTNAQALAYGAPLPSDPTGALDNFIYAGTVGGRIFVTFNGGGANGNAWSNISAGLDGSSVQAIVTNPTRGSREAYAVTNRGVYYMADAAAANATWQNITANVFQITQAPFGNQAATNPKLLSLKSIAADWRYVIPDSAANPNGPTHPMLYVAGNGGVYRSADKGQSWALFPSPEPNSFYASPSPAGPNAGLPNADVRDLDLSLGNIDPTNGRPVAQPGDPNILLATTYGRGSFAIRLAPVVFANLLALDPTLPSPGGSANGTAPDGTPLSTVSQPVLDGSSQQTAFGNKVLITLVDLTDPANPRFIGGYDGTPATDIAANRTDTFGRFRVQVNAGGFTSNGKKTIGVQATDASGTKGNIATFTFTLQAQLGNVGQPPVAPTIALNPADDSSGGARVTNVMNPRIIGITDPNTQVELFLAVNGVPTGAALATGASDALGNYTLVFPYQGDGSYTLIVKATNTFGSTNSPTLSLQIKTNAPTTVPAIGLRAADDTGIKGDGVTSSRNPHFDGTAEPLARIQLYRVIGGVRQPGILATASADGAGNFSIQFPQNLSNGVLQLQVGETDQAGNQGPFSNIATINIVTITGDYTGVGATTPGVFRRDGAGTGLWFIQGVSPVGGIPFGSSVLDVPFTGDFDGDGKADLATYRPSSQTWTIQKSSNNTSTSFTFGNPGDIPVVGDFEGTGIHDVGAFSPSTGEWVIALSTGKKTFAAITGAQAGDIPVPGNYGGTGADQRAIYRPSTGTFIIQGNTVTQVTVKTATNAVGDIPVPGDYDNTVSGRTTEPAVFNPTSGRFTIVGPGGTTRTIQFQAGDIPAPGDYQGKGSSQAAVYRPSLGGFLIDGGAGVVVAAGTIGQAGDIPVLSPLVYRNVINQAPTLSLDPASDTGIKGDNVTSARRPSFVGQTDPGAIVDLINTANGAVLGTATADASGNFKVQASAGANLPNGVYSLQARAHGVVGNVGPTSPTVNVTLATTEGDFLGTAVTSQAVFRRTNKFAADWFIAGLNKPNGTSFGAGSLDVPLEADIDGDGKVDLILYRPSSGQFFAQPSGSNYAGQLLTPNFTSVAGDIPVALDFNGDGKAEVGVYRPSTAEWFVDGQTAPIQYITPRTGDVPVPGDYLNLGKDQLAVYRPVSSQWLINGPNGLATISFGGPNDVPVPGVYTTPTANRRVQPAVFRPSTGQYFVFVNASARTIQFAANDIPVPGDYNGDGLTDPATYRASAHLWQYQGAPNAALTALPLFGGPSDIPVNAPYRYRALPTQTSSLRSAPVTASVATASFNLGSTAQAFKSGGNTATTPAPASPPTSPTSIFRARRRALQASANRRPGQTV